MRLFIVSIFTLLICVSFKSYGQDSNTRLDSLIQTDYKTFAHQIVLGSNSDFEKAQKIVKWLVNHFDWKATDYKSRNIQEIIQRRGGNCAELAAVTNALFKELDIKQRTVREVNIYRTSLIRQYSASGKVKHAGNTLSVFGKRHNDHVWIEVYDKQNDTWLPVDPSLGIAGMNEWLQARIAFDNRKLPDRAAKKIIVPMAVLVTDDKGHFTENRTDFYLVDAFNTFYDKKLQYLPAWNEWKNGVDSLSVVCRDAFLGKKNLLQYTRQIKNLKNVYNEMKSAYKNSYN